jgi:hypothetical protein
VTKACCRCHFKNAAEQESMKNIPIKAAWVSLVASSFVAISLTFALFSANAAESGNEQESKTEELAKETQNPVANLISVPFQNNFNFGIGPNDATQRVLNVQPVIPITLNKDWNLLRKRRREGPDCDQSVECVDYAKTAVSETKKKPVTLRLVTALLGLGPQGLSYYSDRNSRTLGNVICVLASGWLGSIMSWGMPRALGNS